MVPKEARLRLPSGARKFVLLRTLKASARRLKRQRAMPSFQSDMTNDKSSARRAETTSCLSYSDTQPGRRSLEVSSTSSGAEVRAQLHTTRVADDNAEVQQGLEETLATVKQLVEQQAASV